VPLAKCTVENLDRTGHHGGHHGRSKSLKTGLFRFPSEWVLRNGAGRSHHR
jgi:hypothetical protein